MSYTPAWIIKKVYDTITASIPEIAISTTMEVLAWGTALDYVIIPGAYEPTQFIGTTFQASPGQTRIVKSVEAYNEAPNFNSTKVIFYDPFPPGTTKDHLSKFYTPMSGTNIYSLTGNINYKSLTITNLRTSGDWFGLNHVQKVVMTWDVYLEQVIIGSSDWMPDYYDFLATMDNITYILQEGMECSIKPKCTATNIISEKDRDPQNGKNIMKFKGRMSYSIDDYPRAP